MKNKIIYLTGIAVIVSVVFLTIYGLKSPPRTGFILLTSVYSNFDMKKELEKKFTETKKEREKLLDSMAIQLRILANQLDSQKVHDQKLITIYNYKREEFLQKRKSFEEDNKQLSDQYDKQIITQLNQYVKDFGAQNQYEYIFGNDGNGSLMYAQETNDLTKLVTDFINRKYSGK